jgi:hypothetical protein
VSSGLGYILSGQIPIRVQAPTQALLTANTIPGLSVSIPMSLGSSPRPWLASRRLGSSPRTRLASPPLLACRFQPGLICSLGRVL